MTLQKIIKETFALREVPREAYVLGIAGLLPYLGTSMATVYCAWDVNYANAHGTGFLLSEESAVWLLSYLEPLQVGYGAVVSCCICYIVIITQHIYTYIHTYICIICYLYIDNSSPIMPATAASLDTANSLEKQIISFLGAIHWGLEWAGYGGTHGYRRYSIGVIAPAIAWPTVLFPYEYALISQFLAFTYLYYADSRATTMGWAPPWYGTYRFVLTALSGIAIVISLIGRGEIDDRLQRNEFGINVPNSRVKVVAEHEAQQNLADFETKKAEILDAKAEKKAKEAEEAEEAEEQQSTKPNKEGDGKSDETDGKNAKSS
jgi:hypothetical protein